jgi:hypothetical protein
MANLKFRDSEGNIQEILSIKGADGKTPVKGVDYFTENDKAEIINEVIESVNISGDADTVDGKHADDFVLADELKNLLKTTSRIIINNDIPPITEKEGYASPGDFYFRKLSLQPKLYVCIRVWANTEAIDPGFDDYCYDWLDLTNNSSGANGASAYEIACDNGFEGTEQEWLESLNGIDGVGIKKIEQVLQSSNDGGLNIAQVTLTDNTSVNFHFYNGHKGSDGADGKTPVKGVDYYTVDERNKLIVDILDTLEQSSIFGYVDENNNIIIAGSLSDGTYTVKYEMDNGTTVDIGELALTEKAPVTPEEPNTSTYTNLAEPNTDNTTDFTIWCNNARIGSDGVAAARDGYTSTNFVEVSPGDVVRFKNFKVERLCFYNTDKNPTSEGIQRPGRHIVNSYIQDASADIDLVADTEGEPTEMTFTINPTAQAVSSVAYLRLSGHLTGTADDVIITKNEEII